VSTDYDVVVVGGGMVGAVFALACGEAGLRVAIIESQLPVVEPGDQYDLRVSAITLASRAIFDNLGVWQDIARRRVSALQEMYVWDAGSSGTVHFDAAELGEAELGYIVENRVIVEATRMRIAQQANITLLCPADLAGIEVGETGALATLTNGSVLKALLVVGADGTESCVRKCAGIKTHGWSYDQIAIVATVRTDGNHNHAARQIFLPTGPLAFLPLCDPNLSSIVWSCDTQRARALLDLDHDAFRQALQMNFGDTLGEIVSVSVRASFQLGLGHAERYVDARLALIGDAAHRVHPLAGQGVNLGLLDAATLAEVVSGARSAGRDIGALRVLRRYERWRRGSNLTMLAVTDAFKRGFGTSHWAIRRLRNIGLAAADSLGPVKRLIMQRAVGLVGDLPRLARTTRR